MNYSDSLVYEFSAGAPNAPQLPPGYRFDLVKSDNIDLYFGDPQTDGWRRRQYPRLLDDGCLGLLVCTDTDWAAVQWIATPTSHGPPHLPRRVTRGHYWCFNEHTRTPHRRLGLWRALKDHGVRQVRQTAAQDSIPIFSDTFRENNASRQAHLSYGFSAAGVVRTYAIAIPGVAAPRWGTWNRTATHSPD